MRNLTRRLNKAEKALNLNEKPKTVTIVLFGGALLPDRTEGNITYHFVLYDEIEKEQRKTTKNNQFPES